MRGGFGRGGGNNYYDSGVGWGRGRGGNYNDPGPQGGGRQQPPLCRFFQQGNCRNGAACPFLHELPPRSSRGFQDNGTTSWRGGAQGGRRGGYQGAWGRNGGRDDPNRRPPRREEAPPPAADVVAAAEIAAHAQKVSSIAIDQTSKVVSGLADPASNVKLYTGSHDGLVKCWSTETGQCTNSAEMSGMVDSLLFSGGFLFVGIQRSGEGIISVWNMSNGQNHLLSGHRGQILCLHTAAGMLFSGGQDRSIRVWSFNAQSSTFALQVAIVEAGGGHAAPVHCFQSFGSFLFSADRVGIIKVWDLGSGNLAQTLTAHEEAVSQMLVWENFLLSSSLDSHVKIWEIMEQPMPNLVVRTEPTFDFTKEAEEGVQPQFRRPRGQEPDKIITMAGTVDGSGTPIIIVSYLSENHLRLYELPSFTPRGILTPAPDTRSLNTVLSADLSRGHMIVAGDGEGKLRFFQWR